jgi:hypothetical protein
VRDESAIGSVGVLVIGTRGASGPGEVLIGIRGGTEAYLAWSETPLPAGTTVLVIEARGARTVEVAAWDHPAAEAARPNVPGLPPQPRSDSDSDPASGRPSGGPSDPGAGPAGEGA